MIVFAAGLTCGSATSGFMVVNCSSIFLQCTPSGGFGFICPSSLVFDMDNSICNYKERVAACGGVSMNDVPAFVPIPIPIPGRIDSLALVSNDPPAGLSCGTLTAGFLVNGCSSIFVQCTMYGEEAFACPNSLVFDMTMNRCNFPENVQACGGTAAISTTQQSASDGMRIAVLNLQSDPSPFSNLRRDDRSECLSPDIQLHGSNRRRLCMERVFGHVREMRKRQRICLRMSRSTRVQSQ